MTKIEWTDQVWNVVTGCTKVSPGCDNCYAETFSERFRGTAGHHFENGFDLTLRPERLTLPLKWRKPRRVFVNSMSDLFHKDIPDDHIARAFAIMALTPQHTYQILTKRHGRMRSLMNSSEFVGEVRRQVDVLQVRLQIEAMGAEKVVAAPGYPGYLVSDYGHVYTIRGSDSCLWCQGSLPAEAEARRRYCSGTCRQKAAYEKKMGRWTEPADTRRRMSPDTGEQGHQRVTLYRDGEVHRELVHRLVLAAFDRAADRGEQGCHIDGDATNNALPNLRWGTQEVNWDDRKRHGNRRSYSKLSEEQSRQIKGRAAAGESRTALAKEFGISDTQVSNIAQGRQWRDIAAAEFQWPLPGVWLGVSVEDQQRADLRIPALVETPAAVRFLSCEPLLGPVDLTRWMPPIAPVPADQAPATWAKWTWPDWVPADVRLRIEEFWTEEWGRSPRHWIRDMHQQGAPPFGATLRMDDGFGPTPPQVLGRYVHCWNNIGRLVLDNDPKREYAYTSFGSRTRAEARGIDWVIAGGESGPGARPMEVEWAADLVRQCQHAETSVFVKQLGSAWARDPKQSAAARHGDTKGSNPDYWPRHLQVREFPQAVAR
ncbi:DUF5131 family protein [Streptomyces sp. NPDC007148]|uniref:DUF5131 family protein n=1 Tax=Streptomyces sp. NPDC007148 TaxID=3364775 RepID=UPI0036A15795